MPTFAVSTQDMGKQLLGGATLAPQPAPEHGFALDKAGRVPVTQATGESWRAEVVSVAVDVGNTASLGGGTATVSISTLKVDDYCFWIGTESTAGRFNYHCRSPVCTTAGQITLVYTNAGSSTVNPDEANHFFLVLHRT